MPRRCDIWRPGLLRRPITQIAAQGMIDASAVTWLPEQPSFRFLADPFGLWRDGMLHLFAEAYDYRSRHGVIDHLLLDDEFRIVARRTVLKEPWHLSYPFVFEAEGAIWMLPEAYKSSSAMLYRATSFPHGWVRAAKIELDVAPIDATPVFHEGRWWLFYSGGPSRADRMGALHCAWADRLCGRWHPHPANPVRRDLHGGRPGGTTFMQDGRLMLPVQDCSRTYGGAIRLLRFDRIDPESVETSLGDPIRAPAGQPYRDGLHTLSACGDVTLIDAKRIERSGRGLLIDLMRRLRRRAHG